MVKEGYGYGLPLVLVAGGFLGLAAAGEGLFFWIAGALVLVLALLVLNFFRDPERPIPPDPQAIVSPADGRVVQLAEETFGGRPVRRLSIFMSPLDVHVNRAPIAGTLGDVTYHKGRFRLASRPQASVENEQNVFTIEGDQGVVVARQIAGAVARRIVFWKKPGDRLERGERIGMIKFGSRLDLVVEPGVEWRVKAGDRVSAGTSIVAYSAPRAAAAPAAAGPLPAAREPA